VETGAGYLRDKTLQLLNALDAIGNELLVIGELDNLAIHKPDGFVSFFQYVGRSGFLIDVYRARKSF
jgi:hypothetical protein